MFLEVMNFLGNRIVFVDLEILYEERGGFRQHGKSFWCLGRFDCLRRSWMV